MSQYNESEGMEDNRTFGQVKQELMDSLREQDIKELSEDPRTKWSQDYLQDRNAKMTFDQSTGDFTVVWETEDYEVRIKFNKEIELDTFGEQDNEENEGEEEDDEQVGDEGELDEGGQQDTEHPHHMEVVLTPLRRQKAKLKLSAYSNKYSRLVIENFEFSSATGTFESADQRQLVWVHQLNSDSEDGLYCFLDRLGLDDDTALFVQQTVDIMQCDLQLKELRKLVKWLEL